MAAVCKYFEKRIDDLSENESNTKCMGDKTNCFECAYMEYFDNDLETGSWITFLKLGI